MCYQATSLLEGDCSSRLLSGDLRSLLLFAGVLHLLLLGKVFLEELLVVGSFLLGVLDAVDHIASGDLLSADLGLGDHALDLGGLVEGLVTVLAGDSLTVLGLLLEAPANNVLPHVVLLVEGVELEDVVSPLLSETIGMVFLLPFDLILTLNNNTESDDGKIGSGDAASD